MNRLSALAPERVNEDRRADIAAQSPEYGDFLESKFHRRAFESCPPCGPPTKALFPHQRVLVDRALERGRSAVFADTGLGKTATELEWARHVSQFGRVLILAPLAVAHQIEREAQKFGMAGVYARHPGDTESPVVITNYHRAEEFLSVKWAGIVLDESSILKSVDGHTRKLLTEGSLSIPYRLACTATPAPNDHAELGNHAEFLGVCTRSEMLSEYFMHDGGNTASWRLKRHAVNDFWAWVASWSSAVRIPSDLGFDDAGYILEPLTFHDHVIEVDHISSREAGLLFAAEARTLSEQRAVRRETMQQRIDMAVELTRGDRPAIVWAELNAEADAAERAIQDAVQVSGSDSPEKKEDVIRGFVDGAHRVLVTKVKVAGFGLNFQHCSNMVFLGASHSYEMTYQAVRRCWRYGQTQPVDVHVIRAETEAAISRNYKRKEAEAARMAAALVAQVKAHTIGHKVLTYRPALPMHVPEWVGVE